MATSEELQTYLEIGDVALAMLEEVLGDRARDAINLLDSEATAELLPIVEVGVTEFRSNAEALFDSETISGALLATDDEEAEARVEG